MWVSPPQDLPLLSALKWGALVSKMARSLPLDQNPEKCRRGFCRHKGTVVYVLIDADLCIDATVVWGRCFSCLA